MCSVRLFAGRFVGAFVGAFVGEVVRSWLGWCGGDVAVPSLRLTACRLVGLTVGA